MVASDKLVIGWEVDANFDPKYFKRPDHTRGAHKEDDLVCIDHRNLTHHSVIVAQSGSGKSFLVGRLIEEIALKTTARVIVLDPNSDYKNIHHAKAEWTDDYDKQSRVGACYTETAVEEFASRWRARDIRILGKGAIKVSIDEINQEMLADSSGIDDADLSICHLFAEQFQYLVRNFGDGATLSDPGEFLAAIDLVRGLAQTQDADDLTKYLETAYLTQPGQLKQSFRRLDTDLKRGIKGESEVNVLRKRIQGEMQALGRDIRISVQKLKRLAKSIDQNVFRLYLSRLHFLNDQKLLLGAHPAQQLPAKVRIVDIPSFDESARLLMIDAMLGKIWVSAKADWDKALSSKGKEDPRVPTFIVCDEAHNLIGNEVSSAEKVALRESFRRVAAEGRKFGIFLILVSQRPDKLDKFVVSECENKLLMKLGSLDVASITAEALGLSESEKVEAKRCTEFRMGRGILFGPWARESQDVPIVSRTFYTAARRTQEGGKDIASTWFDPLWEEQTAEPPEYDPFSDD